jgi:hypothetical protein
MSTDPIFDQLAGMWRERDPMPPGLVERMQMLARAEAEVVATDWDYELMQLVARSEELAGARGTSSAFTLRFNHGDVELLLRIAEDGGASRIDGWVVPALPMTVQALEPDGTDRGPSVEVTGSGRFELTGLGAGLTRLRLEPHDGDRATIVTPTFEI